MHISEDYNLSLLLLLFTMMIVAAIITNNKARTSVHVWHTSVSPYGTCAIF